MSELMPKIIHYENLIKLKKESNSELTLSEVNKWQLCRTCLTDTTGDDVSLESTCVIDLEPGRSINVKEALISLAKFKLPKQEDPLPSKVCRECFDIIKTFKNFTIQVDKADKVLKLLAQQLKKTDKGNDPIKSEEVPSTEEFLFIKDENLQTTELLNNENTSDEKRTVESLKDSPPICENGQIFIKEEPELIITDILIYDTLNSEHETIRVENSSKEGDHFWNKENVSEDLQISKDDNLTVTSNVLKSYLNERLHDKLPTILENKCPVCQEIFDNGLELVKHANLIHPRTKAFKCRNCSTIMSQISSLYRHNFHVHKKLLKRRHNKNNRVNITYYDNKCAVCKKIFNKRFSFVKHVEQYHPSCKAFKCLDCSKIYSKMSILCEHFKKAHCKTQYKKPAKNVKIQKRPVKHSEYYDNKCAICEKIFYRKIDFIRHGKQFHPKVKAFKCRDCNMHFSYMPSLIFHNKSTHKKTLTRKKHACEICSQTCYSKADLRIHLRIHTGERPFECTLCDKTFAIKSSLKGHLKTHQKSPNPKPKPKRKPTQNRYACEYCGKVLKTPSFLKVHLRVHTGERPYACAVCGQTYKYKKNLRDHHERAHLKKLNKNRGKYKHKDTELLSKDAKLTIENKCAVCNKIFKFQRDLHQHGKQLHNNAKVFKCPRCETVFAKKYQLCAHFKRHHIYWPKSFECDTCCKTFFSKDDLKCHAMVHTGERPYSCTFCSHSYIRKISLNWHIKKCHSKVNIYNTLQESQEYKCELCLKNFNNVGLLKRHLRLHTGEMAYTCSMWEKAYNINETQQTESVEKSGMCTTLVHTNSDSTNLNNCQNKVITDVYLLPCSNIKSSGNEEILNCCEKTIDSEISKDDNVNIFANEEIPNCFKKPKDLIDNVKSSATKEILDCYEKTKDSEVSKADNVKSFANEEIPNCFEKPKDLKVSKADNVESSANEEIQTIDSEVLKTNHAKSITLDNEVENNNIITITINLTNSSDISQQLVENSQTSVNTPDIENEIIINKIQLNPSDVNNTNLLNISNNQNSANSCETNIESINLQHSYDKSQQKLYCNTSTNTKEINSLNTNKIENISASSSNTIENETDTIINKAQIQNSNSNTIGIKKLIHNCIHCDKPFFLKTYLNKHIYKCHPAPELSTNEEPKKELIVTKVVPSEKTILSNGNKRQNLNKKRVHDINKDLEMDIARIGLQKRFKYECGQCKRELESLKELKHHKRFCKSSSENEKNLKEPLAPSASKDKNHTDTQSLNLKSDISSNNIVIDQAMLHNNVKSDQINFINTSNIHKESKCVKVSCPNTFNIENEIIIIDEDDSSETVSNTCDNFNNQTINIKIENSIENIEIDQGVSHNVEKDMKNLTNISNIQKELKSEISSSFQIENKVIIIEEGDANKTVSKELSNKQIIILKKKKLSGNIDIHPDMTNITNTPDIQKELTVDNASYLNTIKIENDIIDLDADEPQQIVNTTINSPQKQPIDKCEQCNKVFKYRRHFLNHMEKIHKKLNCNFCNKLFSDISELKTHLKVHTAAKDENVNVSTEDKKELIRKKFLEMIKKM